MRKVRLSDKNAAIDKLAKILALYAPEQYELEHKGITLDQLVPKRKPNTEPQDA